MPDEFFVNPSAAAQLLARREVDRHQRRIIGVTIEAPRFQDVNGVLEFVVNVRVGLDDEWAVVQNVLIAQEAAGLVTDANVPVTMERSEAGRLTIIGRSEIGLPDIDLRTYTHQDLGRVWMTYLEQVAGTWRDGFGYAMTDPTTQTGSTQENCAHVVSLIEWGSTDFIYGTTRFGARTEEWLCS